MGACYGFNKDITAGAAQLGDAASQLSDIENRVPGGPGSGAL
jgi:hypothetical protein